MDYAMTPTDVETWAALRVAGTANSKRKYESNFPMVRIVATQPGQIVTAEELEALKLVAVPERAEVTLRVSHRAAVERWRSATVPVLHLIRRI
jgi:hypothetical protein